MKKSKPFQVIFKGSLGDIKRLYSFPTFQNLLRAGESMTIAQVYASKNLTEVYVKDQNGEIHIGIEITEN